MGIDTAALMRAVECVVSFFIIGLLGYFLTKRGWFTNDSSAMLSRLVTNVVIPVNLFYNINTGATKEHFLPILPYLLIPAASILITMLLAAVVAKKAGVQPSHRNIFITASACSNTINIGLPINLALFGTDSLPAILVYYMGNTVVFWTIGNYLLASDAAGEKKTPILSLTTVRRIFSPAILGFLAGLSLLMLNIRIPPIIGIAGSQLAGMTTPLSIICIGIAIYQTGLSNIKVNRDIALVAAGRFIISPLILVGLLQLFPVPEMMRNVFIIQASLPPMTNIALLAIQYKSDAEFAAVSVSFGTLCALVTVPIFMVLVTSF